MMSDRERLARHLERVKEIVAGYDSKAADLRPEGRQRSRERPRGGVQPRSAVITLVP